MSNPALPTTKGYPMATIKATAGAVFATVADSALLISNSVGLANSFVENQRSRLEHTYALEATLHKELAVNSAMLKLAASEVESLTELKRLGVTPERAAELRKRFT